MTAPPAGAVRLDCAIVAIAAAASGWTFVSVFGPSPLVVGVPVAAVVPALAIALVRPTSRAGWMFLHVAIAMIGAAAMAFFLAQPGDPVPPTRPEPWRAFGDGLVNGVLELMAITLPAPARPDLLAVPIALTWLCATVGATVVAIRPAALPALVPSIFVTAYTVLLDGSLPRVGRPELVLAGCIVAFLLRSVASSAGPKPLRMRRAGLALLMAAGAATAAVLALPATAVVGAAEPYDVRRLVAPQVDVEPGVNPLDRIAEWHAVPSQVVFSVRTDRAVSEWRLAVLDRYDGRHWSSTAVYTRAGLGVPTESTAHPSGAIARQEFTIGVLGGPYLPAAYRPLRIGEPVNGVDTDTGVLVAAAPVPTGTRYRVESQVPLPAPVFRRADRIDGPSSTLEVPRELRPDLADLLRRAGAPQEPSAAASALAGYLTQAHRHVVDAPGGTSIDAVRRFTRPGSTGTTVQFAETFALAMRTLDVPSRIVVGFVPPSPVTGAAYPVHTADARAWVELRLAGVGWTSFQVTPPAVTDNTRNAGVPPEPLPPPPTEPAQTSPPPRPVSQPARPWIVVAIAGMCLLAYAIGHLILVTTVPMARRRRRRRNGSARDRVLGAWHQALDDAARDPRLAARLVSATPSTMELRAAGDARPFAIVVNSALFTDRMTNDTDARFAWAGADRIRAGLRSERPLLRRLRYALSLANLRRRPRWR